VVLRVVDACDDARDRELLLREQRDDEIVLVVSRCRDHDVARVDLRVAQ